MATKSDPALIAILTSTLDALDKLEELSPDDPAVKKLKFSLLQTLAELGVKKSGLTF